MLQHIYIKPQHGQEADELASVYEDGYEQMVEGGLTDEALYMEEPDDEDDEGIEEAYAARCRSGSGS